MNYLPSISGTTVARYACMGAGCYVTKAVLDRIDRDVGQLKAAIFIGAEHLSQDTSVRLYDSGLHGAKPKVVLEPVVRSLRKMDAPNARAAVQALDPVGMSPYLEPKAYSKEESARYQQKVLELVPGAIFAIGTYKQHAMVISAQKKADGRLIVRIHNGGLGIERFHHSVVLDGERVYQTALEFDEVKEEDLLRFIDELCLLHDCGWKGSDYNEFVTTLYTKTILHLKGVKLGLNPDLRYWPPHQTGGSCSGYSTYCFVRSVLTEDEFKEFLKIFTQDEADRLESRFHSRWRFWEKTEIHAQAIKELRMKHLQMGKPNGKFPRLPHFQSSLLSRAIEECIATRQKISYSPLGAVHALIKSCLPKDDAEKRCKVKALRISAVLLAHPKLMPFITYYFGDLYGDLRLDESLQIRKADVDQICALLEELPLPAAAKDQWIARFRRDVQTSSSVMLNSGGEAHIFARSSVLAEVLCQVSKEGEKNISSPGAKKIASAFTQFKEGNSEEAFRDLRDAYRILANRSLSEREKIGCIQALLPLVEFVSDSMTPAVSSARTQDEMEFFLATAILYKKIRSRFSRATPLERTLAEQLLPHKSWESDAERYGSDGLAPYFSRGPWQHDLALYEQEKLDARERLKVLLS